ncbi:MAG TPA: glycosyltransferase family 4 protein [Pyrinomonadaceae bacterium]|nr:glycosyltransferase family 4 protein [Pyrinomonadaceae bacterium]
MALASYPIEAASTRYRVAQFVEPLAKQGITLTIHPFLDSRLLASLYQRAEWPRTALGLTRAALRRMGAVWRARQADVLFVQREAMMFGPPLIEWLAMRVGRCPMVLDLDDATYVSYLSPTYGRWGSALKWFSKTNDLIRWAKIVTCGNRAIAEYVTGRGKPATIVYTVVDTERFRPAPALKGNEVPVIGWVGTHSTYQYLASVFPALQRLAKDHRFRLKVVGAGREEIAIPGVEVENLAWNLEREISDFQSFDIGLYPILEDDWSVGKSGFKSVQYMAVGVPFVTTPVGACAEIGTPNLTHLFATTEDQWYSALSKLLADEGLRQRMGDAGREHAVQHYTVAAQAEKLADVFRSALDTKSATR